MSRPGESTLRAARPGRTPDRSPRMVRADFKIVGHKAVFGNEPGSVVRLELTEDVAAALIESGHIAPHPERAVPEKESDG